MLPLSVRGLRPETREVDRDLWIWFCKAKQYSENHNGPRVTKRLVQAKAKQAFQAAGICNFKASDGWYFRWLKRWHRMDVDSAKRLKNEEKGKNKPRVPNKQSLNEPKVKTARVANQKNLRRERTENVCGPVDTSTQDCANNATISNMFLEIPTSVSDDTLQVFNANLTEQDAFSFSASNDSVLQNDILCGATSSDFDNSFLSKDFIIETETQDLGPVQFTQDPHSLVNLDDISWHDISDLPCLGRPTQKLIQSQGAGEDVFHSPKCGGISMNVQSLKFPTKGKGKLYSPEKSLGAAGNTTSTTPYLNRRLFLKGVSSDLKKLDTSHSQPFSSSVNPSCGKKLSSFAKTTNPLTGPTKHAFGLAGSSVTPVHLEEPKEACVSQVNVKGLLFSSQNSSKSFGGHGKFSGTSCKGSTLRLGRASGQGKKGNFYHLMSRESANSVHEDKYQDFEDTACGNFEQHDLEDVSVSSDFVNQLNDEHSLDLNLECGNETLCNQITPKVALNKTLPSVPKGSNCETPRPALTGFTNLISSSPSNNALSETNGGSPESGCHMSVADDDLSSEENDYISEAVMLSMQEDDFSILNCDQSPFQGTISVIDENSQSECDKIKDLDEGMQAALTLEENDFESGEIMFPPPAGTEYAMLCQKEVFVHAKKNIGDDSLVSSDAVEIGQSAGSVNTVLHSSQENACQEQQEHPIYSPCRNDEHLTESQDFLTVSSFSNEGSFQTSVSIDGTSSNRILGLPGENSSLGDGNGGMFQISSSTEIGSPNVIQLSANDDVFLTCYNEVGAVGSLPSNCISNENNLLSISNGCPLAKNIDEAPSMFFVPCVTEEMVESSVAPQFNTSGFSVTNTVLSSDANSLNSDVSKSEVTVAHADSTTVLSQPSPVRSQNSSVIELIASTDFNSTCPSTCESSKENGFTPYDLQLVESVLSEQDDAPGNTPKYAKKSSAYLTEKGNNTSRSSGVEENQGSYRRSSGDRYFPYFKERVANYAIKHTAKEAARYFGVNVDTVTMWTRGRHETDSVVKNYPDQHMLRWLKKNRENGIVLTNEQVVEKATELMRTPGNWVKDKTRWFYIWSSRLISEHEKKTSEGEGDAPARCGEKKALYPEEFKVEVALYAEQTSKNLASSVFKIARKRVYEWSVALKIVKNTTKEKSMPADDCMETVTEDGEASMEGDKVESNTLTSQMGRDPKQFKLNGKGMGRAVTSVAVDHQLWLWFCDQTAKKSKPKSKEIRAKAVELFRAHNHEKIKCSHGWLKKWSLRYGIALRHEGDGDLVAWCLEQFDHNRNVSHRDLLNYAHELLTGTHKSEFKASAGWLVRFCKRHKNLLSTKPSIDVEIPTVLKQKVSEFRLHVQKTISSSNVFSGNVGCLDEVPLNFTAGGSRSRLLLRRSGLENCHAIVILSCLATGELLPPALIFKGEGPSEQVTHDSVSVLIFYQKDCCMTPTIMSQWLDSVWIKNVDAPSVLVGDCYEPHCSQLVKEKCSAADVSLLIIPPGCSYKLQPLDLSVSHLLESNIYDRWTRHFTAADQLSACKRTSYSSNSDIVRWVAEAYISLKETRKEAVCRSFHVTGLTAALNGTDDHHLEDPSFLSVFTSQH